MCKRLLNKFESYYSSPSPSWIFHFLRKLDTLICSSLYMFDFNMFLFQGELDISLRSQPFYTGVKPFAYCYLIYLDARVYFNVQRYPICAVTNRNCAVINSNFVQW